MLPYEILVGLRATMCTCARGFNTKQNSMKQLNLRAQSFYNFSTVSIKNTSRLELKYKNVHINGMKRFHTNLLTNCQASPNDSKSTSAEFPLVNQDSFDDLVDRPTASQQQKTNAVQSDNFVSNDATQKQNIPPDIQKWMFSESVVLPNKDIEKLFPAARVILHNIYTVVANETKLTNPLTMSSRHVNLKKKIGWACTYKIKWPEEMSFTTISHSKPSASESAALKCLYYLHLNKRIQNRLPIIYEKQERLSLLKAPDELKINEDIFKKLNNFLDKYTNEVQEALANYQKEDRGDAHHQHQRMQKSHPVSFLKVNSIEERNESLKESLMKRKQVTSPDLPIFQYKSEILKELDEKQALVIKGDTGCGKTTQVPQFIIDHLTEQGMGASCSMVVTQPRRISAISLAERVAVERGERIGDVVGYQVRLQQVLPKQNGGILFCTTGILLKKIQNNPNLEGCSHVIVDEAHERSVDTDMLLVLLRRAIRNNPSLKVIIMSATINADLFQEYLDCRAIDVPGRMFPVKMHLMDDMFDLQIPFHKNLDIIGGNTEPQVDCDQVTDLIRWIDEVKPDGAILCFLPGWGHINKIQMNLNDYGGSNYEVIPLHSKIPYINQSKVFQPPPRGKRKIILATDVAETGITVPDVVYVIDTACHKEVRWHENKGLSSIDTHWISMANLNQRKGRAGRVQEGESYHFVTRKQFKELDAYPLPEVLRVSLEKTVLDCKTYSNEKVGDFLGSMPQPPRHSAVMKAVHDLQILGALNENEDLTALGKRIALFSIHPKLSKALVYASIFQCLSPTATVVAALSMESDIFYGTLENKSRIRATKTRFHPTSDHLAISWIHTQWQSFLNQGRQNAYTFSRKNGLHGERMNILDKVREINLEHLRDANMIGLTSDASDLNHDLNEFAVLDELVRGVLLAGMDQILKYRNFEFRKGRLTKAGYSMVTEDEAKAQLTTESVNHKRKSWPSPYLVYYQKTHHEERRTTLIRESSMISPLSVLLFSQGQVTGKRLKTDGDEEKILLRISGKDNVQLMCDRQTAETILRFRDLMWSLIQFFVENDVNKGGLFDDRDQDDEFLISVYKKEMLKILGNLLVSSSEAIDSPEQTPFAVDVDEE